MITKEQRIKIEELIETKATALADLLHAKVASETKAKAAFEYVRASDSLDSYLTSLTEEPAAAEHDGWIDWRHDEQPVADDVIIEIMCRGGDRFGPLPASNFEWEHYVPGPDEYDVIAYRVVS